MSRLTRNLREKKICKFQRLLLALTELRVTEKKLITWKNFIVNWKGKYARRVNKGRLRPEVQLLTILYTIYDRKGTLFVYLLSTNGTPITHLVWNVAYI